MFRPTEIHLVDEKTLTAKALAYDVLARQEPNWLSERPDAVKNLEQSIGGLSALAGASDAKVTLSKFLEQGIAHIESSLGLVIGRSSRLLVDYVGEMDRSLKTWPPLSKQSQAWLRSIHALGVRYLDQHTLKKEAAPRPNLFQDVKPEVCRLGALAGVTEEEHAQRIIWIYYHPEEFKLESYFALPYVVSHEFWCHVLSRLPPGRGGGTFGCSSRHFFEEGWMDHVQLEILKREMVPILGGYERAGTFEWHCEAFHHLRNNRSGYRPVLHGVQVARQFQAFLHQYRDELGIGDADVAFFQVSLDLNLLCDLDSAKSRLVIEVGDRLLTSGPREKERPSTARQLAKQIPSRRDEFLKQVKKVTSGGHIDPNGLLKVLKIN